MNLLLIAAGGVLLAVAFLDAFTTTLIVSAGGGPLTRRLTGLVWRGLLRVHRRDSESTLLSVAGTVLLVATVLTWVALLWAGWTLILLGGDAIVDATTEVPASGADIVYYAGFTVFTLGVGDYVAATAPWRVATAAASFSGLFLITLAITYLVSVVSAVVARRAIAIQINALGVTAEDIAVRGWAGDAFSSAFIQQLGALNSQLATSAEQHLAYPVLHYFHSRHPAISTPRAVAALDEAMLLLSAAVAPAARPDISAVDPMRRVVDRYLNAVAATSATPHGADPPPPPDLQVLAAAGIPVVSQPDFHQQIAQQADRRRRLHQLVSSDGWSWPGR